jgi:hypothetical protein
MARLGYRSVSLPDEDHADLVGIGERKAKEAEQVTGVYKEISPPEVIRLLIKEHKARQGAGAAS